MATIVHGAHLAREDLERKYLRMLLRITSCWEPQKGNVSCAAAVAQVFRQMIEKRIRKHGLERGEGQGGPKHS